MPFFLPPPSAYKVLVPETLLNGGIASPNMPIPAGTYKTLKLWCKFRDVTNTNMTKTFTIQPFASSTPSCVPQISRTASAVQTFSSPGVQSGAAINAFMGTNAAAGFYTEVEYTIYDCDKTTPKWAHGIYSAIDGTPTMVVTGWWDEIVTNVSVVDGFRLLTNADVIDTASSYKVYQLE